MPPRPHPVGRRVRRAVAAAVGLVVLPLTGVAPAAPAASGTATTAAVDLAVAWDLLASGHEPGSRAAGHATEVRAQAVTTPGGLALVALQARHTHRVELVAVDLVDGSHRWTTPLPLAVGCAPTVGPDGAIWAVLDDPNRWQVGNHLLARLDPADGTVVPGSDLRGAWSQHELTGCAGAPRVLADGRLVLLEPRGSGASLRLLDPAVQDDDRRTSLDLVLDEPGNVVGLAWDVLPDAGAGPRALVVWQHDDATASLGLVDLPLRPKQGWKPIPAPVLARVDLGRGHVVPTGLRRVGDDVWVALGPVGGRAGRLVRVAVRGDDLRVVGDVAGPDDAGADAPFDPRWLVDAAGALVLRDGADVVGVAAAAVADGVTDDVTGVGTAAGTADWAWDASGAQHLVADEAGAVHTVAGGMLAVVAPGGGSHRSVALPTGLAPGSTDVVAVAAGGRVLVVGEDAATGAARLVALDADDGVGRRAGDDRYATSVAVSRRAFPDAPVPTVVLARGDAFPDALAGGPLAASLGAPLLLTGRAGVPSVVRAELARLGASRVVLLGGETAVGPEVVGQLEELGLTVERLAGDDRYATAALVADRVGGREAYLVEGVHADPGRGWPDAVAVSGVAAARGVPILLTHRDRLPVATAAAAAGRELTVVGGTSAVSATVASAVGATTRIAGDSRYATSRAVAEHGGERGVAWDTLWVATGTGYADALAAGPAAAATGGTLLLVHGRRADPGAPAAAAVRANRAVIAAIELVGGSGAISAEVAAGLVTAWSPGGAG